MPTVLYNNVGIKYNFGAQNSRLTLFVGWYPVIDKPKAIAMADVQL